MAISAAEDIARRRAADGGVAIPGVLGNGVVEMNPVGSGCGGIPMATRAARKVGVGNDVTGSAITREASCGRRRNLQDQAHENEKKGEKHRDRYPHDPGRPAPAVPVVIGVPFDWQRHDGPLLKRGPFTGFHACYPRYGICLLLKRVAN
jgi:hypothetical protein